MTRQGLLAAFVILMAGPAASAPLQVLMSVEGSCSLLLVDGKEQECAGKLVHSEYEDGRLGFYFFGPGSLVVTFTGDGAKQTSIDDDTRTMPIDGVIIAGSATAVYGECIFGNPYGRKAPVECSAIGSSGAFKGIFQTNGEAPKQLPLTKLPK